MLLHNYFQNAPILSILDGTLERWPEKRNAGLFGRLPHDASVNPVPYRARREEPHDLPPRFRAIDNVRDWLPIRRERCDSRGAEATRSPSLQITMGGSANFASAGLATIVPIGDVAMRRSASEIPCSVAVFGGAPSFNLRYASAYTMASGCRRM